MDDLAKAGAPLILRRGDALTVLRDMIGETGAKSVTWTRLTDGAALKRDRRVKTALAEDGEDSSGISVSANVALTSDYRFRGLSFSDGDIAVQFGVPRPVHLAHTALAKSVDDFVGR